MSNIQTDLFRGPPLDPLELQRRLDIFIAQVDNKIKAIQEQLNSIEVRLNELWN